MAEFASNAKGNLGVALGAVGTGLSALNGGLGNLLGLVDGENIDAEAVLAEMKKQAQKGTATVSLPVLGAVTFGPEDVDALYRNIMGA